MSAVMHDRDGIVERLLADAPNTVMVLDGRGSVVGVNEHLASLLGLNAELPVAARMGDAIGCMNAAADGAGCGSSSSCLTCPARTLVRRALRTGSTCHGLAELTLGVGGVPRALTLPLSAAPVALGDEDGAVLLLGHVLGGEGAATVDPDSWNGIVSRDQSMLNLFETIRRVAPIDVPVLIQGESGSGKELVATALHRGSSRCDRPFVPVSCAALPEGLLESELFGHVKGAFTGATKDKKGRFELADGGTIFLDEIGELSPAMQVKLLRVLQTRSFERVGGESTVTVDVRVVSATNKNLEDEVAAGRFRADLYYRLCVVPIVVPSLRERPGDIMVLAEHLLKARAFESGRLLIRFSPEAAAVLRAHHWPGNVRELDNAVRYAVVHCRGSEIGVDDLPAAVRRVPVAARAAKSSRLLDEPSVTAALTATGGNRVRAAKRLRVSRATLYRFLADRPGLAAASFAE